ncbi:MAG: PAS domain S-box protein, partial [Cyanobacteria bacterium]|nr:PAS domain S-box protein [Cyanobacteriota bacterium]
ERRKMMDKTREHIASLKEIIKRENKTEYSLINELSIIVEQTYQCMTESRKQRDWESLREVLMRGDLLAKKLHVKADRLLKHEYAIQTQQGSWINLQYLLCVALVTNFILTVISGRYFAGQIANRLSRVTENSVRLASNMPLRPTLSGSDEIAQLDRVLHDAAKALEQAAQKERALTENANDVICSLDEKGRFVLVNPAATEEWGYSTEDLLGRSLLDLVVDEDKEEVVDELASSKEEASSGRVFETRIKTKDGRTCYYSLSINYSRDDKALFCVAHDITDRRELEELRQRFLAMVSHDLRSPLTSILGLLNVVTAGGCGDVTDSVQEQLKRAEKNMTTLISLINDLLDVERLNAGRMPIAARDINIAIVVEKSIEIVQGLSDAANIQVDAQGTLARVYADPDRITQVLVNLLSNAIKFSPPDSSISVDVEENTEAGLVTVVVSDQGRGIPETLQSTIFDQYRQVRVEDTTRKGGAGIGLAICQAIIEQHGGEIGVDSEEGVGSDFWFTLPASAERVVASRKAPST